MKSFSLKGINGSVSINYKDKDKSTKMFINDICIRTKEVTKNGDVSFTISDLITLSNFVDKTITRNKNFKYTMSPNLIFNITNIDDIIYEACIEYGEQGDTLLTPYTFKTTLKYLKEFKNEMSNYIKS